MEWIVLGLLILQDMTIYELNSAFKQGLSLIYSASYGNLQYAVKKLLNSELIIFEESVENGRNKKTYRINDAGRAAFYDWMTAEIPSGKLETAMLSKVYFLGLIEDKAAKADIVRGAIIAAEHVETGLREMELEVKAFELPDGLKNIVKYQFKTLDYGIMAHEAGRQWLNELLKDIEEE